MALPTPSPSRRFRSPCWVGASRPFSWRQRLSWLISALCGTVEIEIELVKSAEIDELYDKMLASFALPNSSSSLKSSTE